jgi:hypothetical protein
LKWNPIGSIGFSERSLIGSAEGKLMGSVGFSEFPERQFTEDESGEDDHERCEAISNAISNSIPDTLLRQRGHPKLNGK